MVVPLINIFHYKFCGDIGAENKSKNKNLDAGNRYASGNMVPAALDILI